MIFLQPVDGIADQIRLHLAAPEIKDKTVPIRLHALARIGMLVQMRTIKVSEAMFIRWKMRRHPIENHADALLMQLIDKIHKILRRAITAGGSKLPDRLIAP